LSTFKKTSTKSGHTKGINLCVCGQCLLFITLWGQVPRTSNFKYNLKAYNCRESANEA